MLNHVHVKFMDKDNRIGFSLKHKVLLMMLTIWSEHQIELTVWLQVFAEARSGEMNISHQGRECNCGIH